MYEASSEAKNAVAEAMSSGFPNPSSNIFSSMAFLYSQGHEKLNKRKFSTNFTVSLENN